MGVLKQPQKLNLLISAAILLSGLLIHWLWHPPDVREHRFVEKAFEFWILKWMLFVVTWGLLTANTDLRFVLAGYNLNSVVGIGLVAAMWKGDAYNERHTIIDLIFLFGLLFSWNFVIHPLIGAGKLWLFPSMMTSCIFIASIGYVIFARYGSSAITFLVVSVAYLFLQLPTYLIVYL